MKVLHVAAVSSGASGPSTVLSAVVPRLVNRGHSVGVVSIGGGPEVPELVSEWGATFYSFPGNAYVPKLILRNLAHFVPDLVAYQVVHLHGVFNAQYLYIVRALRRYGLPYVVTLHGNLMPEALRWHRRRKTLALALWGKALLRHASVVHALSEDEAGSIIGLVGGNRIRIVPNGVDIPSGAGGSSVEPGPGLEVLYVGRLDVHNKGLDILLRGAKLVAGELRSAGVRITLVGPFRGRADERYVRNMLRGDLSEVVRILGPMYGAEKEHILKQADVFIYTSRHEGMPMAVLEAMAHGKPCIVTPGTNMGAIISKSRAGFVIGGSAEDVALALRRLLGMPRDALVSMGRNAQNWCRQEHNWDMVASSYEMLYRQVLDGTTDR